MPLQGGLLTNIVKVARRSKRRPDYAGKQVSSLLGGNPQTAVMPLNVTNFRPGYMYSFSIQIGNGLIDIL